MRDHPIQSLEEALSVIDASVPGEIVRLVIKQDFTHALGPQVALEILRTAQEARPTAIIQGIVDCENFPGLALNALRHGAELVKLIAPYRVLRRVQLIAADYGARVESSYE